MPEFLGPLALGIFLGAVAVSTAAYLCVEIVIMPKGGNKIMKDCFNKPIKVVSTSAVRPGDFIHDIADSGSLFDIEKRKGHVISIASEIEGGIILRLVGRKTPLAVPADSYALITRKTAQRSTVNPEPINPEPGLPRRS